MPLARCLGSPPQVRGKPVWGDPSIGKYRITPAGAGKTGYNLGVAGGKADHPRRCGENLHPVAMTHPRLGSPPQVRGKQIYFDEFVLTARITPAGAGKTRRLKPKYRHSRDHPRRCGENRFFPKVSKVRNGSPPQVRGKLYCKAKGGQGMRITPAGAGKTAFRCSLAAGLRDHPRRCGENLHKETVWAAAQGSPPQVRGKLSSDKPILSATGITPAGAGKTFWKNSIGCSIWDHPRRCGENVCKVKAQPLMPGSPPQVRGKH